MTEPSPDVLTPAAEDRATRKADPAPVSNPEAPFGYMTDPVTKEVRPRKRPGKQKAGRSDPAAPPARPANKARSQQAPPSKDFSGEIGELCQGVWMLMASVPTVKTKIGKIDLGDAGIKIKAQASILKENGDGVVKGINMMAQHSPQVRKGVAKLTEESGPAWILPAMMIMLPFVGQSAAMWRAPVSGDVTLLAKRTEQEFDDLMNGAMRAAAEEQASAERLAAEDASRA